MGKGRYEGASKTFILADHLIRKHEKRLEDQAKQRKEKECEKGRRITREAFFKEGSKSLEKYTTFAKRLAGGEEAYNEQMAAQARQDEEDARKEPVTDQERYEKLINGCRLKKDDLWLRKVKSWIIGSKSFPSCLPPWNCRMPEEPFIWMRSRTERR